VGNYINEAKKSLKTKDFPFWSMEIERNLKATSPASWMANAWSRRKADPQKQTHCEHRELNENRENKATSRWGE